MNLGVHCSIEAIQEIEDEIKNFLKTHPREYHSKFTMDAITCTSCNRYKIIVRVSHKASQNGISLVKKLEVSRFFSQLEERKNRKENA